MGPFLALGSIRQKAGKLIHAWGWEGDADPAQIRSITMETEWPRGSGRRIRFPRWIGAAGSAPAEARIRLNPAQAELVDRLESTLGA